MQSNRTGLTAVIFSSVRTMDDDEGYFSAAAEMERLAATQPGYCGITSARAESGRGVTVSYWTDDAAAKSWRDHPEHARIRDMGRAKWYSSYTIDVAYIERSYDWDRNGDA